MPSWRLRNLLNVRLLAGLLCLTGMGMAAGAGPTGATHPRESQPADKAYEIVRMSKPDGTVVEMRVPRHRSLLAKRPAGPRGTVRQLPGTAAAGEEPSETPQIGGRRAVRLQQAPAARASSEGPSRPDSGRVVTQRANPQRADTGTRISHPYTGSRQLTSGAVDVMRPTAVPRGGAVSQTPVVASDNASEWRTGLGWVPNNEDDDTGRYLSSDDAFAELVPGDGWDGPTDDPDPVGNESMPGWDAKAIARWDVVPYQTFDEEFHIGVVAFHINGIDRVEFSVDGGPWVSVEEMQLNPRTDVWEYTAVLHPEYFDEDGLVEVRAIVWPEGAGVPRVLGGEFIADSADSGEHSLFAWSNASGSLPSAEVWCSPTGSDESGDGSQGNPFRNPYKALQSVGNRDGSAGGTTCYLEEGSYSWGPYAYPRFDTENRWATIAAAPGADKSKVVLDASGSSGMRTHLMRVANCTITVALTTASQPPPSIWFDNCDIVGPGRYDDFQVVLAQSWLAVYFTDCSTTDVTNAYDSATLARNVSAERLGSDAFSRSRMVVNATVNDIDAGGTSYHPDLFQISGSSETIWDNILLYNVFGTNINAQGLFADDVAEVNNIAFVNVCAHITAPVMKSQWKDVSSNHLLLWHTTLVNQPFVWRAGATRNLSVLGGVWQKVEGTIQSDGFRNNHYIESDSYAAITPGTDITIGDPQFNDPDRFDFSPRADSPLLSRLSPSPSIADYFGRTRPVPASLGAFSTTEDTE